jgi:hypothetical protein
VYIQQRFVMGNNGSKKPVNAATEIGDHDRAVLDLKNARDTLKQYQKKVSKGNGTCLRGTYKKFFCIYLATH